MKMKMINIDDRLTQIASYIRTGKIAADIGTDHAYLPVWLIQNGKCKRVIASDINAGPCQRAVDNVKSYGLGDKIEIVQANGLIGIDVYKPDDIIIAGMGGELIWDIISAGDYVKMDGVQLILQPMSKIMLLRRLLTENGFDIIDETLARVDRRIYEVIHVGYNDVVQRYSEVELLIGRKNIENRHALFTKFVERKIYLLSKNIFTQNEKLIEELRALL